MDVKTRTKAKISAIPIFSLSGCSASPHSTEPCQRHGVLGCAVFQKSLDWASNRGNWQLNNFQGSKVVNCGRILRVRSSFGPRLTWEACSARCDAVPRMKE